MRIATWNVNSIKQRMDNLAAWLVERQPDIVCLQETKCVDDAFPREALEALGYNVAVHGQKAFNGVAVLSKFPLDEVTARLPGDTADDHARFMETVVSTAAGVLRSPPSICPTAILLRLKNIRTRSSGWTDSSTMYMNAFNWRSRWS